MVLATVADLTFVKRYAKPVAVFFFQIEFVATLPCICITAEINVASTRTLLRQIFMRFYGEFRSIRFYHHFNLLVTQGEERIRKFYGIREQFYSHKTLPAHIFSFRSSANCNMKLYTETPHISTFLSSTLTCIARCTQLVFNATCAFCGLLQFISSSQ